MAIPQPSKPSQTHHYRDEQWLPYPVESVFAFFANPQNLPPLMPDWQQARIEAATYKPAPAPPDGRDRPAGIVAGDGTLLTLSFRAFPLLPVRLTWVAQIGDFEWWRGFCDSQLKGPFRYWHHCHSVRSEGHPQTGEPGTRLLDDVEFALPLEPLSRLALPIARAQLEAMFAFRHMRTLELMARQYG